MAHVDEHPRGPSQGAGAGVSWWLGQFTRLDEMVFAVTMLLIGLFLEDWIDQWRGRKQ